MSKQEFIEGLRRSLSSINDYSFVNETITYYENYIESHMRMGESEDEIMTQLGDPRLIAKSIRATYGPGQAEEQSVYSEFEQNPYDRKTSSSHTSFSVNGKEIRMPSVLIKVIGILILLLVLFVVFTVLRWLSPFIMMGFFAYLIYKIFVGKY